VWRHAAERQDALGVPLFFEELLTGGEPIELGYEAQDLVRVGPVDDRDHANAEVGHTVGH
jgi:hypothetical protein